MQVDMQNVYIDFFKHNYTIKQTSHYSKWWKLVIRNSKGTYYYNYYYRVKHK